MHAVCVHQPGVVARADRPRGGASVAGARRPALQCCGAPPKRGNSLRPGLSVFGQDGRVLVTLQDPNPLTPVSRTAKQDSEKVWEKMNGDVENQKTLPLNFLARLGAALGAARSCPFTPRAWVDGFPLAWRRVQASRRRRRLPAFPVPQSLCV